MNSLLYSLISSGENSAFVHFAAAIANQYNFGFLVPPGTHHYWVDRQQHDMRGLPDTSAHGQQRDSNTGHPSKY